MRRQRTRNASAQFRARQEGMIGEGKHCGKCGDYHPSISTEWERWICDDCGGNVVRGSHKVVNAGSEQPAPGAARRARFARVRNKQKAPRSTFVVSSFLDKPDRPKPVKKVTRYEDSRIDRSRHHQVHREQVKCIGFTPCGLPDPMPENTVLSGFRITTRRQKR